MAILERKQKSSTIEPINIQHDIQYTNEELATYRQINTIKK